MNINYEKVREINYQKDLINSLKLCHLGEDFEELD